jgi:hypothetical protein
VSPVKYELGSYIAEDDILRSHRRETLRLYESNISELELELALELEFLWEQTGPRTRLGVSPVSVERNVEIK